MTHTEMLRSTTDFIHQSIVEKKSGAIAIVKANNQDNRYFQIFTCGNRENIATGELQIQVVGPKYARPTDDQKEKFQRLLESGWGEEEGNAEIITHPVFQRSDIENIVQMLAKHLAEIYELDEACNWNAELFFC